MSSICGSWVFRAGTCRKLLAMKCTSASCSCERCNFLSKGVKRGRSSPGSFLLLPVLTVIDVILYCLLIRSVWAEVTTISYRCTAVLLPQKTWSSSWINKKCKIQEQKHWGCFSWHAVVKISVCVTLTFMSDMCNVWHNITMGRLTYCFEKLKAYFYGMEQSFLLVQLRQKTARAAPVQARTMFPVCFCCICWNTTTATIREVGLRNNMFLGSQAMLRLEAVLRTEATDSFGLGCCSDLTESRAFPS